MQHPMSHTQTTLPPHTMQHPMSHTQTTLPPHTMRFLALSYTGFISRHEKCWSTKRLRDFRLSPRFKWDIRSSGMLRCVETFRDNLSFLPLRVKQFRNILLGLL